LLPRGIHSWIIQREDGVEAARDSPRLNALRQSSNAVRAPNPTLRFAEFQPSAQVRRGPRVPKLCAMAACQDQPIVAEGHTFLDYPAASAALIAGCKLTWSASKTAGRFVIVSRDFSVADMGNLRRWFDGEKNASGARISVSLNFRGR
jgi:hypothetical protein